MTEVELQHPAVGLPALRPRWRALRVGVLGSLSLLLATAAHITGGGALPSGGVLAVTVIALALIAVPLTGRQLRWWLLSVVLGTEQFALHLVFSSAAASCPPPQHFPTHAAAAYGSHGMVLAACGSPVRGMTMGGHSPLMWTAHAVATLLTVALLTRGEAWLWSLATRAVAAAAAPPRRGSARRRADAVFALTGLQVGAVSKSAAPRGPPAPLCR
jgi:hypothetical protein